MRAQQCGVYGVVLLASRAIFFFSLFIYIFHFTSHPVLFCTHADTLTAHSHLSRLSGTDAARMRLLRFMCRDGPRSGISQPIILYIIIWMTRTLSLVLFHTHTHTHTHTRAHACICIY
jgi:hypothetical protein